MRQTNLHREKPERFHGTLWAVLTGGFYSAANLLGGMLKANGYITAPSFRQLALAVLQWFVFTAVICLIWAALDGRFQGHLRRACESGSAAEAPENHAEADGSSKEGKKSSLRGRAAAAASVWEGLPDRRKNLILWALMLGIDLISLLAVYPGFFLYDASEELAMVQTGVYSAHHPLLHVLLMGGILQAVYGMTGSYNTAIFIYLLLQAAVILAAFTYMLADIRRRGAGWGVRVCSVLWLVLCPTVTMFVLCSCKDGLFSAALIVMTVEMRCMMAEPAAFFGRKRHAAVLVLSAAAMMLLRKNGVYAFAVFLVLYAGYWVILRMRGCLHERRSGACGSGAKKAAASADAGENAAAQGDKSAGGRYHAKGMVLLVLSLGIYLAADGALTAATKADTSESQEILTVPLMQLARTWNSDPDSFTEAEQALMDALMEDGGWERYTPKLSDQMKACFRSDVYRENRTAFWRMWLHQALQHPMTYVNAWLMTSYGFWYPDAVIDCYEGHTVYTFTYGDSSYFGYETEEPGERRSLIPALDAWYRYLSLDADAQNVPVLHYFLSCGAMFWVFAFMLATLLRNGRGELAVAYLPILLVWMTVLLGPCTLPRYVVYLWFGLPLFVAEIMPNLSESPAKGPCGACEVRYESMKGYK